MIDDKALLGLLTIAIGVVSYSLYFFNIFRGKTKPDPYSWLIWGVLAAIGFLAKIPMHRMGEPDDIGKALLFLASDMSSYLTGSQIVVDGGVLLT